MAFTSPALGSSTGEHTPPEKGRFASLPRGVGGGLFSPGGDPELPELTCSTIGLRHSLCRCDHTYTLNPLSRIPEPVSGIPKTFAGLAGNTSYFLLLLDSPNSGPAFPRPLGPLHSRSGAPATPLSRVHPRMMGVDLERGRHFCTRQLALPTPRWRKLSPPFERRLSRLSKNSCLGTSRRPHMRFPYRISSWSLVWKSPC